MEDAVQGVAAFAAEEATLRTPALLALAMIRDGLMNRLVSVIRSVNREVANIRRDKRGRSNPGRKKRLKRLACRWMLQYFGSPTSQPIYSDSHFRDTFGVPKLVFSRILNSIGPHLRLPPACDGTRAHDPDVQLLVTLRMLRTGSPFGQFDDQTGMGVSTIREKFRFVLDCDGKLCTLYLVRLVFLISVCQEMH